MSAQSLREANERLRAAVDAAVVAASSPDIATVAHVEDTGSTETFSLVRGVWMETFPGLKVMLIDDSGHCGTCPSHYLCPEVGCTRVLAEAKMPVKLPAHSHTYPETIHVIEGIYRDDRIDGIKYHRKGSMVFYKAHTLHEPIMSGLFLICWSPPLSREEISRQVANAREAAKNKACANGTCGCSAFNIPEPGHEI